MGLGVLGGQQERSQVFLKGCFLQTISSARQMRKIDIHKFRIILQLLRSEGRMTPPHPHSHPHPRVLCSTERLVLARINVFSGGKIQLLWLIVQARITAQLF